MRSFFKRFTPDPDVFNITSLIGFMMGALFMAVGGHMWLLLEGCTGPGQYAGKPQPQPEIQGSTWKWKEAAPEPKEEVNATADDDDSFVPRPSPTPTKKLPKKKMKKKKFIHPTGS